MKIAFIRPNPSPDTIGLQHLMVVEPLELEILATLVQDEHEVEIFDLILDRRSISEIILSHRPDVVCLTGYITHIGVMIECCQTAKSINDHIVTIVGGVHIEKFPEDINHPAVDYRVVRNATIVFPQLIAFLEGKMDFPNGVIRMNEVMDEKTLPDYDFYVPIPNRTLTQRYRKDYFYVFHNRVALLKTSFGCPYKCKFCFCREITGKNYHARPMDEVIAELKSIKEREIYIVDDDFLLDPKRVNTFIENLKKYKLDKKFLVYGRADFIASHPEIIKEFRKNGLRTVIVGLESFDDNELDGFNKKTTLSINQQAMNVLNGCGVDCYAAVIISPSWGKDDFVRAKMAMRQLKIKFVNLQPLTPLKGTGLEVDESQLVISRNDFAKWDLAHVVIRPEKMGLKEFYKCLLWLYLKIVLHPKNVLSYIKYPLAMQWKMMKGQARVKKQYKQRIAAM